MEIINFTTSLRIGHGWPAVLDVAPIGSHETVGVYATTYPRDDARIELRQKEGCLALFTFKHPDVLLPEWWQDSQVVWQWQPNSQVGEQP